jgi:hypothetical protein
MKDPHDALEPGEENVLREALTERDAFSANPSDEYVAKLRLRLMEAATHRGMRKPAWPYRLLISCLGAATIAASVLIFLLAQHSSPAWASAIRLARQREWVHIRLDLDGVSMGESWVSPGRNVFAAKLPVIMVFSDYGSGTFVSYDVRRHVVDRTAEPVPLNQAGPSGSFSLLSSFFRNSVSVESIEQGASVGRTSRRMSVDGTPVDEFELEIRQAPKGNVQSILLTVDGTTSLPRSLTVLGTDAHMVTCNFDYPRTGPVNPQALGIPATTPTKEFKEEKVRSAVTSLRDGVRRFDDYMALCVTSSHQKLRPLVLCDVKRVLRRGNKWRVDQAVTLDRRLRLPADPQSGVDVWRTNSLKFHYQPLAIFDGRMLQLLEEDSKTAPHSVTKTRAVPQAVPAVPEQMDVTRFAPLMPERACRPVLWTSDISVKQVKAESDGKTSFVRIEVRSANRGIDLETVWVDPAKDYVAAQILQRAQPLDFPIANHAPQAAESITLSDFRRSPRGFWYATTCQEEPTDKSLPRISRFYVDFSEHPSDNLFEVTEPNP